MTVLPRPREYGVNGPLAEYLDTLASQLEQADTQSLKRGREIEVGEGRIVLRSPNGSRYELTVDNSGTLGTTAL